MTQRTHPLKLWRLSQAVTDQKTHARRPMTIADAARLFGCPFHTWRGWELPEGHPNHRKPNEASKKKIYVFTKGQVRPDHFTRLPDLRGAASSGVAA